MVISVLEETGSIRLEGKKVVSKDLDEILRAIMETLGENHPGELL